MTETRGRYTSDYELDLLHQCRLAGFPVPVRQHKFHPTRRFRFDLAWPDRLLAVEVDGGIWTGGRHVSGAGFTRDCVKLNEAILLGWRVLRFTPAMVQDGSALQYIHFALNGPGQKKLTPDGDQPQNALKGTY